MNLQQLFKTQAELDKKIVEEKGLQGQDLLDKKILALQVELGELAQNWRGFKFWSEDQEPRTKTYKSKQASGGEFYREIHEVNPMLEEYVDCLHFILSIGLEEYEHYHARFPIKMNFYDGISVVRYENITKQFNRLFDNIGYLEDCIFEGELGTEGEVSGQYKFIFRMFLGLGEMLGFTWDEIEKAYYAKNKENYERQENGY